jgi:hypothetical protein
MRTMHNAEGKRFSFFLKKLKNQKCRHFGKFLYSSHFIPLEIAFKEEITKRDHNLYSDKNGVSWKRKRIIF